MLVWARNIWRRGEPPQFVGIAIRVQPHPERIVGHRLRQPRGFKSVEPATNGYALERTGCMIVDVRMHPRKIFERVARVFKFIHECAHA